MGEFIVAIRAVPDGDCDIPSGLLNDAAVFVTRNCYRKPLTLAIW